MSSPESATDIAIIGAGIIGLSVAYYLVKDHRLGAITLIDSRDPMSLTSAQSGENYRNWWPHPVMTAFTDRSIELMEAIAVKTGERIAMTRRGYALVTRNPSPTGLIEDLYRSYGSEAPSSVRMHDQAESPSYRPARSADWKAAPAGVDVLCHPGLIRRTFPYFAGDVATVLHVRRAGSISGQQLGQFMLETVRAAGGRLLRGKVVAVEAAAPFRLAVETPEGNRLLEAGRLVNAAGPFFGEIAALLGESLPAHCVYQQKIAFEDRAHVIARDMPFAIDLDGQVLPWTAEERLALADNPDTAALLAPMSGGIHCRPDGGDAGSWIKLGWAFNEQHSDPHGDEPIDPQFPDLVLRAASRLHPGLARYIGHLPRGVRHYGGYYTMTAENLPLIGPMRTPGAFMAGSLSGYGTMAACAAGELAAAWITDGQRPAYATSLSLSRHTDAKFMTELTTARTKGAL
ncbi:MAG TPA: FAD-dependent oxidoreductase [Candidatus Polarisedimenticolia bacterium]|nr:FAD-dependent oxidoreductase [Candidatus Polarisedimenticolia bacterium]